MLDVDQLRRTARHLDADVLIGVQGSRLVLVIGRRRPARGRRRRARAEAVPRDRARSSSRGSAGTPGARPRGAALVDAARSARAALAGFAVARAWRNAPRPSPPTTCCPSARSPAIRSRARPSINRIYRPLQAHSTELLTTLWSYLDNGRSLEATARELFVHPNTVRYRLKRVSEVIGWDATGAREALILQTALIVGSIAETDRKP